MGALNRGGLECKSITLFLKIMIVTPKKHFEAKIFSLAINVLGNTHVVLYGFTIYTLQR